MTKYLFKRLLHGLVSVVIVVGCVMTMIYSLMDRNLIFAQDTTYSHQSNNQKRCTNIRSGRHTDILIM